MGKREKSDRLSLSHIAFLLGLCLFCDMCVLSVVADYRIKIKLDLLFCKGWVGPLRNLLIEDASTHKDISAGKEKK